MHLNHGIAAMTYQEHILSLCNQVNILLKQKNISDIYFDIDDIKNHLNSVFINAKATAYENRIEEFGVVHPNQLSVLVNCIIAILENPDKHGSILGAMQSGKTTASFTLHWIAPIIYLLTGKKLYISHLLTNQHSHEDQTRTEMEYFFNYYGWLPISCKKNINLPTEKHFQYDNFSKAASLDFYTELFLKRHNLVTILDGNKILRRTAGKNIDRIREICIESKNLDLKPILLVDEPQWGSKSTEEKKSVLSRMVNIFDEEIGGGLYSLIGLSATPFGIHSIKKSFWSESMPLPDTYSGYNIFEGQPIDSNANITPPRTMSFQQFGKEYGISKLFDLNAKEWVDEPTIKTVPDNLSKMIEVIASLPNPWGEPRGICIRAINNNEETKNLVGSLSIDTNKIEILIYNSSNSQKNSIKKAIYNRDKKDLPFVIFVSGSARLGDAFPKSVDYFIELTTKTGFYNSLLQGLLGRACGHGKKSTVIMSSQNIDSINTYVNGNGIACGKYSETVDLSNTIKRKKQNSLIIDFDNTSIINHDAFKKLRDKLQSYFDENIIKDKNRSGKLTKLEGSLNKGNRYIPIIQYFLDFGIFDEIENNQLILFPQYIDEIKLMPQNTKIKDLSVPEKFSILSVDTDNKSYVLIRDSEAIQRQGVKNRGTNQFVITIGLTKVDAQYNILNKNESGYWRVQKVSFPLQQGVRELDNSQCTYPHTSPKDNSDYNRYI